MFAGVNGQPRGNKEPDNNNFGPRAGVAYSVTAHFVVRSGFGIMYVPPLDGAPSPANTGALGFSTFTDYVATIDGGKRPYSTLSNPFPDGFNNPINGHDGLLTSIGAPITNVQVRGDRTPYVAQWHFNTQYESRYQMLFDAGYAGSAGVKLPAMAQLNQLPDQFLALGDALGNAVSNPFLAIIPAASALGKPLITAGQLLRPYPQFQRLVQTWGSLSHSSYHALQAKFRKQYHGGLQTLVAYTWSKALDENSGAFSGGNQSPAYTDNNRRDLDKSYSVFDIRHRLVASFQYELPLGAGRALLNRGGIVDAVAGRWVVSGIATFATGGPISIGAPNATGSPESAGRPNRTGISSGTPGSPESRLDQYLNPAAFTFAPAYTFGNAGRFLSDTRDPGRQNWDLAIAKEFRIGNRAHAAFRGEADNLLNHPNFLPLFPPATTFGQRQFGTITGADSGRTMQLALKLGF